MIAIKHTTAATVALLAFLPLGALAPATGEEWSRSGPAGSVTRTYDADTGTRTVERSGAHGGSSSATATCTGGLVVGCERSTTVTGPDGNTVSGSRSAVVGPFRARGARTVTGPDGNSVTRFDRRRRWR